MPFEIGPPSRVAGVRHALRSCVLLCALAGASACTTWAPYTPPPPVPVGSFEGVVDPGAGTLVVRTPAGGAAGAGSASAASDGAPSTGDGCTGPSFEVTVRVTNDSSAALENVFAQIDGMTGSGTAACNGDPTNDGLETTWGLWFYGTIPAGGSATRTWRFARPDDAPYGFSGRVYTVPTPGPAFYAGGAGHGWGAQIQNLYLDSDGHSLAVMVKMDRIGGTAGKLWILASRQGLTTGMTDFALHPPQPWGPLGFSNPLPVAVDFSYVGNRANLASSMQAQSWTTPSTFVDVSADVGVTQDDANGTYLFTVPYGRIGGATRGSAVRVYALFGDLCGTPSAAGIHSMAPSPSAGEVANMNQAGCAGLGAMDVPAPDYVLR